MKDLAPHIVRQRLLIEGNYGIDVDTSVIEAYFATLIQEMGFRSYGQPTIFAPGGEGREENQGYDAFVPLIDSGVSLYVWTQSKFLAVVVFTCKRFDAAEAIDVTRDFFEMPEVASMEF